MSITLPVWAAYVIVFGVLCSMAIFFTVSALVFGAWLEERAAKKK